MNRSMAIRWLSVAIAAGLVAGACSSSKHGATGPTSAASPTTVAQAGGSATLLIHYNIATFDPAKVSLSGGTQPYSQTAIFDDLVYLDDQGHMVAGLAQSLTSTDQVHWVLKLRPNLVFSDGTPFDAAAVKFNWTREQDPTIGTFTPDATSISDMTVADPTTLNVTLKSANAQFPRYVMDELGLIGSPTAIQAEGDQFGAKPVGAGPFVLTQSAPGDHWSFAKNPHYYLAPKPYLDSMTLKFAADNTQQYNAFSTGQGQMVYFPTADPHIAQLQQQGYPTATVPQLGGIGLIFNTTMAPFDDASVRLGLSEALDLNQINQEAVNGAGIVPTTWFPSSSPFYDASLTLPNGDMNKAQQLISAYVAQHGPINFTWQYPTVLGSYATAVQQAWNALKGVHVNLAPLTPAAAVTLLQTKKFTVAAGGPEAVDPAQALVASFSSTSRTNYGSYSNPQMDQALTAGLQATTLAGRKAAYETVQKILVQDVPLALMYRGQFYYIGQKNVMGMKVYSASLLDWSGVWLSK
ncbi:MAG: ABC transporter substrate-binding protein [Acidimicrobiales bacterium]|nr:ABC transporter substrate-binding protein [Acidimicrobiales bacterium]